MYSILIVDDEPAAVRYLRSIIETKCPAFRVADTAGDGAAALLKARESRPDLVITDIRMPGVDGLDFASGLKRLFPRTPAIIVSGFQEFEYARRALGTGVAEYLLKPVSPRKLALTLEALIPVIEENRRERRLSAAHALLSGDAPEASVGEVGRFWIAALREGGLPSRFRAPSVDAARDAVDGAICALRGRDGRETVFFADRAEVVYDDFVRRVSDYAAPRDRYRTLVFAARETPAADLKAAVSDVYRTVDGSILLGETVSVFTAAEQPDYPEADPADTGRIEYCLANNRKGEFEQVIRETADRWRSRKLPLLRAEGEVRRLLSLIEEKTSGIDRSSEDGREYALDALISGSPDWTAFAEALVALARNAAGMEAGESAKADAPGFFDSIRRHVDDHYAERIALGSVSRAFRISPTYVGRLFRKYEGVSFTEYLTAKRVEAAKRLLRESPTMPIKDIACGVGISDPLYFSRVFKSIVGLPPSEFR